MCVESSGVQCGVCVCREGQLRKLLATFLLASNNLTWKSEGILLQAYFMADHLYVQMETLCYLQGLFQRKGVDTELLSLCYGRK